MAPVTSSFIADIIASFFDDFESKLGPESTTYPTPAYLAVKTIRRAGGYAQPDPPDSECPALWMEYLAGGEKQAVLGTQFGYRREDFNLFAKMVLTPERMGMDSRDLAAFRRALDASVDTLLRRIIKVCADWSGAVTDGVLGGTTNGANVDTWAYVLTARNDTLVEGRAMIHLYVDVE